jgi:hypothetical protein
VLHAAGPLHSAQTAISTQAGGSDTRVTIHQVKSNQPPKNVLQHNHFKLLQREILSPYNCSTACSVSTKALRIQIRCSKRCEVPTLADHTLTLQHVFYPCHQALHCCVHFT